MTSRQPNSVDGPPTSRSSPPYAKNTLHADCAELRFLSADCFAIARGNHQGFGAWIHTQAFIGVRQTADLVGTTPNVVHAFQFGEVTEDNIATLLFIETMRGVIGTERLKQQDMPPGFKGKIFVTTWQGFQVDGIEIPETVNGANLILYNVQIPLKAKAIQIRLLGPAEREETLKPLLRQILDGLEGESNWFSSLAPAKLTESENYGAFLLGLAIAGIIAGLVILWFVSSRTAQGTVLVIAVVLYASSWQIDGSRVREVWMLSGSLRMLGFAGGILGLIDFFRKRNPKAAIEQARDAEPPPGSS